METTKKTKNKDFMKSIKLFLKKSIPVSTALLITLNSTLGVALIQNYFYQRKINEFVTYLEATNPNYTNQKSSAATAAQTERLESELFPEEGIVLPLKWNDIGKRLVEIGVIDQEKFMSLFKGGPLSSTNNNYEEILAGTSEGNIVLTNENSRFVLNTLWALGLAQQSLVLDDMQAEYPEVQNLAATGGWTVGQEDAMTYYGQHQILNLSADQQVLVKQIAENIYRPCCNNHTAFADCNHGMAMLGLVEMMVAEGFSEDEIYEKALAVNAMWFPDNYLTIAKYMEDQDGLSWDEVDPRIALGAEFSSGSGFQQILAQVDPVQASGSGGSCGV